MKISRGPGLGNTRYADVKQGDVFVVIEGSQGVIWLRISTGLVNTGTGAAYSMDYIAQTSPIHIYPDATLVLEP